MKATQNQNNNKYKQDNGTGAQNVIEFMKNRTFDQNKVPDTNKNIASNLKQYLHERFNNIERETVSTECFSVDTKDHLVKELNDELKHASIIDTTYKVIRHPNNQKR